MHLCMAKRRANLAYLFKKQKRVESQSSATVLVQAPTVMKVQ